ncbi:MAG: hypothetical protein IGS50_17130 [Synechococcales cyanobacterium C42_A2020_086]|nr:hypothetical protein [Synechococcales cyanobacterium C42_A2020_086]
MNSTLHNPSESIKSYVVDRINRRNNIQLTSVTGKSYILPILGILEVDNSEFPPLISRFELSSTQIDPEGTKLGNLFVRLDKFVAPLRRENGKLTADITIMIGFLQSNADFEYLTFPTLVRFEAKVRGSTLVATLSGSLPQDMPIVGDGAIQLNVLGVCDTYGEFSAKFSLDGKPHPVHLQISNGDCCLSFSGITEISELVPSHATYILDWSVSDTASAAPSPSSSDDRGVRDVISDVVIGSGSHAQLEFSLFDPAKMYLLDPVILAQEPGTNAKISNELKRESSYKRTVTLVTTIEGTPNRYVLLDTIGAARNLPTRDGSFPRGVFVAPEQPTGEIICCNLKPPGPNSPGSEPVLRNPPGGSGGVPDPPEPSDGGSGQPNSSTSEGGNSCDVNYAVILPPTGRLVLETQARALEPDEREVAFAGAFRNGARIPTANLQLLGANGYCIDRPLMPIWIVSPGYYDLLVQVPAERTLRKVMELKFPIDTRKEFVSQIAVYPPTASEIQNFSPLVVGSAQQGVGFSLIDYTVLPKALKLRMVNEGGGWILVSLPEHCNVLSVHTTTDSGVDLDEDCRYCSLQSEQGNWLTVFWLPKKVQNLVVVTR